MGTLTGDGLIKKICGGIRFKERWDVGKIAFVDEVNWGIVQSYVKELDAEFAVTHDNVVELKELVEFYDPLSIDSFLSQQSINFPFVKDLGKFLIAYNILASENADSFKMNKADNWYRVFYSALISGKTPEQLVEEPLFVTVVTFNYDVSLEYYLISRIRKSGLFTSEQAEQFIEKVLSKIVHVYGSVRDVACESFELEYGRHADDGGMRKPELFKSALLAKDRIKVIYEQRDRDQRIHDIMMAAKRIFVLGFAFDEDNLKLLLPQNFAAKLSYGEGYNVYYTWV
jgi:hypothetical protein